MPISRCPRCGNKIGAKQRFCPECGLPISEADRVSDNLTKYPIPFRLSDGYRKTYAASKPQKAKGAKKILLFLGLIVVLAVLAVFIWPKSDSMPEIKNDDTVPVLKTGKEFHDVLLKLADSEGEIKRFCRSDTAPPNETKMINISGSGQAVQAWYNSGDGTIYWYTDGGMVSLNEDAGGMFSGFEDAEEIDFTGIDTGNVTDMTQMFYKCSNLLNLDVSGFDTKNVTNMKSMFNGCANIISLDLSSFDTGNVMDMGFMFWGCSNLTILDLSSFDAGKVTNMSNMFSYCNSLSESGLKVTDEKIKNQFLLK